MNVFPTSVFLFFAFDSALVVWASVGDNFKDCKQFLYMRTPPVGIADGNLKKICQRYNNKPRFATLYDAARRVPVYSAYTFKKSDGQKRVDVPWMYEPQLGSPDEGGNMQALPQGEIDQLIEDSQAVLQDYADAVLYERGPLNPDEHQADNDDKAATYTLTNIVPQITTFFEESWSVYLDKIRKRLNNFCRGKSYIVTGITTSGSMIRRDHEDRLAVPKYLWSAYCCPRFDRNSPYDVRYMFPTYAAYGQNDQVDNSIIEVPLKTLESFLKNETDFDRNFNIFYKDCIS
ncbi:endonuclease domain-containing 1 protein-like [Lepisosteus oculatus]|nr:PREDICTED: endonuclease domain-containing 1 protein-like [Lepisosteus oculatus]